MVRLDGIQLPQVSFRPPKPAFSEDTSCSTGVFSRFRSWLRKVERGHRCHRDGGKEGLPASEPALRRLDAGETGILRCLPELPGSGKPSERSPLVDHQSDELVVLDPPFGPAPGEKAGMPATAAPRAKFSPRNGTRWLSRDIRITDRPLVQLCLDRMYPEFGLIEARLPLDRRHAKRWPESTWNCAVGVGSQGRTDIVPVVAGSSRPVARAQ